MGEARKRVQGKASGDRALDFSRQGEIEMGL